MSQPVHTQLAQGARYLHPTHTVVGELTADETKIVLLATGDTHEIAYAAKVIQTLTPLISPTVPSGALELPVTWQAVTQLAYAFGSVWRPGPALQAWIEHQVELRAVWPDLEHDLHYEVPPGLTPRPYQVAGALMIARHGRVVLTDEQGTGKTITAILGLCERATLPRSGPGSDVFPAVVVCPGSVVIPWLDELRTWAPHLKAVDYRGPQRDQALEWDGIDVYVTSYDTARLDANYARAGLVRLGAKTLVLDEHHYLKNAQAKRTKAARRLARKAQNVVALSGTPITHGPDGFWPTLDMVFVGAWPAKERWVPRYCLALPGDYEAEVIGLNKLYEPELRTALMDQHRRVAKADVLDQLPPKVWSTRVVELPDKARERYDSMEADMLAELDNGALPAFGAGPRMTFLNQLASANADVEVTTDLNDEGEEVEHYHAKLKTPSWKVDALLDILAERDKPTVAFAPSRQLVMLAGSAAEDAGYKVGAVVGGQTPKQRALNIEAFQRGELDLLVATTGAGGTGITLTAADCCVFLQRPWSLVEALQAEDRLHRIGAEDHESVDIIDIVAARTVDQRVRDALRDKAGTLAELLADSRIVTNLLGGHR